MCNTCVSTGQGIQFVKNRALCSLSLKACSLQKSPHCCLHTLVRFCRCLGSLRNEIGALKEIFKSAEYTAELAVLPAATCTSPPTPHPAFEPQAGSSSEQTCSSTPPAFWDRTSMSLLIQFNLKNASSRKRSRLLSLICITFKNPGAPETALSNHQFEKYTLCTLTLEFSPLLGQ